MNLPSFLNSSEPTNRSESLYYPHPGDVFKRRFIAKTTLRQEKVAEIIGVSPKHLSRFINGHVSVTILLARKLEFCTNVSAGAWLHYQAQYDLYKTAKLEPK